MLLLSCFALLMQGNAASVDAPEKTDPWKNVEVLRKVLVRQLGEKRGEIAGEAPRASSSSDSDDRAASAKTAADDVDPKTNDPSPDFFWHRNAAATDSGVSSPAGVTNDFLNTYAAANSPAIEATADYAPGLAAVFSLTVPVKVDVVRPQGEETETPKPDAKSKDDDVWEEVASGGKGDGNFTFVQRGSASVLNNLWNTTKRAELSYNEAAITVLRKSVVDTLYRFGHKLDLPRGERIAVVVHLTPSIRGGGSANEWRLFYGDDASPWYDVKFKGKGTDEYKSIYVPAGDGKFEQRAAKPVAPVRIVIQVSADDLRAYKADELRKEELAKKTRVERY